MRPDVQASVSLLFGIVTLRLSLSRLYLNFVRPAIRPWLISAGVVLVLFGAVAFLRAMRGPIHAHHDDGHDHEHVPFAAWLLILPVLTLFLVTPAPLGSYAAGRQSNVRVDAPTTFDPLLAPRAGAITLTLGGFVDRALYDSKHSLTSKNLRLLGFVVPSGLKGGPSFYLSRFVITCCAADARSVKVGIYGVPPPATDSWVEITGRWRRPSGHFDPLTDEPGLSAKQMVQIPQPDDPYED